MKVNPQEVFDNLSKDLAEMQKGLKSGMLSKKEVTDFHEDLQEVILEASKTKFTVRLDILKEEEPNLSKKDVLVKMLDLLPSDVNPDFLPDLIEFVLNNWKVLPQKKVA